MASSKKSKRPAPVRQDVRLDELEAIVERTTKGSLSEDDHGTLKAAVDTLGFLTQDLEGKDASIARLRKYLFGASTEKTNELFDDRAEEDSAGPGLQQPAEDRASKARKSKAK